MKQRPTTAKPLINYKEAEDLRNKDNVALKQIGQCLANFQILTELGKGSYGIVYKVKSNIDDKIYVLKKINLMQLKPKQQNEALKEAQILRKLRHPNIIRYFISFIESDHLCIIMEYAEGGDLQQVLKAHKERRQSISEETIWNIAKELALALQHIHENNIIHRDIKTLNIFLTKEKKVKLGDLGVSKFFNSEIALQGTRVGTPLYLSPELIQHLPYDYKIDVWAYGCVIYHLATLEPPFSGDNLINLGYNIVNKTVKPLGPQYSQKLNSLVSKLLEKLPSLRPTIKEVIKAFFTDPKKETAPMDVITSHQPKLDHELIFNYNFVKDVVIPIQRPMTSGPFPSSVPLVPVDQIFFNQRYISNFQDNSKASLQDSTEKLKITKKITVEQHRHNIKFKQPNVQNLQMEPDQNTEKILFNKNQPEIKLAEQNLNQIEVRSPQNLEPLFLNQPINKKVQDYQPILPIKFSQQIRPLSAQARRNILMNEKIIIQSKRDNFLMVEQLLNQKNLFQQQLINNSSENQIQDNNDSRQQQNRQVKQQFTIYDLYQNSQKQKDEQRMEKIKEKDGKEIIIDEYFSPQQNVEAGELSNQSPILSMKNNQKEQKCRVQSAVCFKQKSLNDQEHMKPQISSHNQKQFNISTRSKREKQNPLTTIKRYTLKDLVDE